MHNKDNQKNFKKSNQFLRSLKRFCFKEVVKIHIYKEDKGLYACNHSNIINENWNKKMPHLRCVDVFSQQQNFVVGYNHKK